MDSSVFASFQGLEKKQTKTKKFVLDLDLDLDLDKLNIKMIIGTSLL